MAYVIYLWDRAMAFGKTELRAAFLFLAGWDSTGAAGAAAGERWRRVLFRVAAMAVLELMVVGFHYRPAFTAAHLVLALLVLALPRLPVLPYRNARS
eukprot:339082-Hanusia_phi.AAC.1